MVIGPVFPIILQLNIARRGGLRYIHILILFQFKGWPMGLDYYWLVSFHSLLSF